MMFVLCNFCILYSCTLKYEVEPLLANTKVVLSKRLDFALH